MAGFIARQPNGLLCRFSTIVDTITNYNMTDEEYIEMCAEKARVEARNIIENYMEPFQAVKDHFYPNNMTRKEFKALITKMSEPINNK